MWWRPLHGWWTSSASRSPFQHSFKVAGHSWYHTASTMTAVIAAPSGISPLARFSSFNPSIEPRGLKNVGNSCYLNAVLQALAHSDRIYAAVRASTHSSRCQQRQTCVLCAFERCVLDLRRRVLTTPTANPAARMVQLLPSLTSNGNGLRSGRQEDAHEYLSSLVSTAQECRSVYGSPTADKQSSPPEADGMHPSGADSSRPNYLVDLFQGRLLSRVYCSECGGVSSTVDATQGLELEVGRAATLQAALAEFCRSERLEERLGNAYHCERCRGLTSAEKCLRLSSVPDVLRIQLKRFCYDESAGPGGDSVGSGWGCRKLTHLVEFPPTLDVAPFTCLDQESDAAEDSASFMTPGKAQAPAERQQEPLLYQLSAVIVHLGRSPDAGHYTAYVRHGSERAPGGSSSWFLLDDEVVRRVPFAEVQAQQAYILIYERAAESAGATVRALRDDSPAAGTPSSMLGRRLRAAVLSPQSPFVDPADHARADSYSSRYGSNPLCSPPLPAASAVGAETAVAYHVSLQQRRAAQSAAAAQSGPVPALAHEEVRGVGASPSPRVPLDTPASAGKRPGKSLFSLPHRRFLRSLNFFMRPSDISGKRRRERDLQGLGHHLSNRHAPAHTPAAKAALAYFSQQQYEAPRDRALDEEAGAGDLSEKQQEEEGDDGDGDSPSKRQKLSGGINRGLDGAAGLRTPAIMTPAGRPAQALPKPAADARSGSWFMPFIPARIKSLFGGH